MEAEQEEYLRSLLTQIESLQFEIASLDVSGLSMGLADSVRQRLQGAVLSLALAYAKIKQSHKIPSNNSEPNRFSPTGREGIEYSPEDIPL